MAITTSVRDATESGAPAAPGERLAPPPKLRRRPALMAAAVAAISMGALLSVWAFNSTSNAEDILAMRQTVERGQVIDREDLMSVKVGVDPALHPLAADQIDMIVGKRAALDMPAGGVVTAEQVTDQVIPTLGESIVGIALTVGQLPAEPLRPGDRIRLVLTPAAQGEVTTSQVAIDAVVQGVTGPAADGQTVVVDLVVPAPRAPEVAALAGTGRVALVLDSRER